MSLKPSIAEQWFVEDGLTLHAGLCPMCRADFDKKLNLFGATTREALSQVYKLSRDIRVSHLMAGRMEAARDTDDWEVLRVMDTVEGMVGMSMRVYLEQQPEIFGGSTDEN